ncbi:matrilin-3-like [Haliotis cracherodii]|uniref:matrilin-3-like n=1 Tax=Haliotis cracherodii TaxID=6455 RepID=UPI0039ED2280
MEKDPITLLLLLLICHSCYNQALADPCKDFKELDNIEDRDPSTPGYPILIDDSKLTPGWYGAPGKWEMLSQDPGNSNMCGTQIPIYRQSEENGTSTVCNRVRVRACYRPHTIETRMCNGKEIYYLSTPHRRAGFCFFNNDPCGILRPCANGGTCTQIGTGYSCACPPNFSGVNCTVCNNMMLDILFIEDVSLSIGKTRFDEMKRFQESMLNPTTISRTGDNVALMVFSSNARVVFKLNKYSNSKSDVLEALKQQTYEDGPTSNFGDAIKLASSQVFSYSYGDRFRAANKVVMFTDGYTTSEDREAIAASIGHLKSKAEVFVVAISAVDANSTVNVIASKPSNVFQIDTPNAASAIQQRMKTCRQLFK